MTEHEPALSNEEFARRRLESAINDLGTVTTQAAMLFEEFPEEKLREKLYTLVETGSIEGTESVEGLLGGFRKIYADYLNSALDKKFLEEG